MYEIISFTEKNPTKMMPCRRLQVIIFHLIFI